MTGVGPSSPLPWSPLPTPDSSRPAAFLEQFFFGSLESRPPTTPGPITVPSPRLPDGQFVGAGRSVSPAPSGAGVPPPLPDEAAFFAALNGHLPSVPPEGVARGSRAASLSALSALESGSEEGPRRSKRKIDESEGPAGSGVGPGVEADETGTAARVPRPKTSKRTLVDRLPEVVRSYIAAHPDRATWTVDSESGVDILHLHSMQHFHDTGCLGELAYSRGGYVGQMQTFQRNLGNWNIKYRGNTAAAGESTALSLFHPTPGAFTPSGINLDLVVRKSPGKTSDKRHGLAPQPVGEAPGSPRPQENPGLPDRLPQLDLGMSASGDLGRQSGADIGDIFYGGAWGPRSPVADAGGGSDFAPAPEDPAETPVVQKRRRRTKRKHDDGDDGASDSELPPMRSLRSTDAMFGPRVRVLEENMDAFGQALAAHRTKIASLERALSKKPPEATVTGAAQGSLEEPQGLTALHGHLAQLTAEADLHTRQIAHQQRSIVRLAQAFVQHQSDLQTAHQAAATAQTTVLGLQLELEQLKDALRTQIGLALPSLTGGSGTEAPAPPRLMAQFGAGTSFASHPVTGGRYLAPEEDPVDADFQRLLAAARAPSTRLPIVGPPDLTWQTGRTQWRSTSN